MNIHITSKSTEDTESIGFRIGQRLRGGELIELASDLGGGKTTFTRGLVAGAGSADRVSSPTFTVSKEYRVPQKPNRSLRTIVHADLYRLTDPGLMEHDLVDAMNDETVALIIEWAQSMAPVLPKERVVVRLIATDGSERSIDVSCPDSLQYLVEDL